MAARRLAAYLIGALAPLALIALFRVAPVDERWESRPAHFWLVLSAGARLGRAWLIPISRASGRRDIGEVIAGVVGGERGHRKHGVVGDTVNLASRLEGAAPVGEVVVGVETMRRLPPGAVVERLPELQ